MEAFSVPGNPEMFVKYVQEARKGGFWASGWTYSGWRHILTKNCLSLPQEKITENGNLILIEEIYPAASTYSYAQPEALFL